MKLSVLMSVYAKESPGFLSECLVSIATQTLLADEVVLVEDGPLGNELLAVIETYRCTLPIVSVKRRSNAGLGEALREGLMQCRGEWVARMDSDDICAPIRFERQLEFLERYPEIDVLGAAIDEFADDSNAPHSLRALPCGRSGLEQFARWRNPLNHVTVMFRRSAVLVAGGYRSCPGFEDYDLWARMLMTGHRLENLQETLVHVRCGNGMLGRRGGVAYAWQEVKAQRLLRDMGFLTRLEALRNIALRVPVRVAPRFLRGSVYRAILRSAPASGAINQVYPSQWT